MRCSFYRESQEWQLCVAEQTPELQRFWGDPVWCHPDIPTKDLSQFKAWYASADGFREEKNLINLNVNVMTLTSILQVTRLHLRYKCALWKTTLLICTTWWTSRSPWRTIWTQSATWAPNWLRKWGSSRVTSALVLAPLWIRTSHPSPTLPPSTRTTHAMGKKEMSLISDLWWVVKQVWYWLS